LLGQKQSFYDDGLRQFDGQILDWLLGNWFCADGSAICSEQPHRKQYTRTREAASIASSLHR
jgi:hypothetical protein